MNNVILICGQAGSGKNTLADILKKHIDLEPNGVVIDKTLIRNNAQSVKDIATNKHNWNGEKDAQGRQLLLDITEQGYAQDKFYWEDTTFTEAIMHREFINKQCDYLIIPDWRYESTLEYFKHRFEKVLTIRVERPNIRGTHNNHSSENNFKAFDVDLVVENNEDLSKLDKIAKKIARELRRL